MTTKELVSKYRHIFGTDYTADANCQGAWLFTEGSGLTVADDSQNTNTGDFKGAGEPAWAAMAGTNAPSYSSYMVTYDGDNDDIDCSNNSSLNYTSTAFSIVAWGITSNVATQGLIFCRGNYQNDGYYFQLINQRLSLTTNQGSANQDTDTVTGVLTNNEWTHMAVVRNGTGVVIYVDGSLASLNTVGSHTNPATSTRQAYIGKYDNSSSLGWLGSLGEVGSFDRTLDSTEINDIMDNGLKYTAPAAGGGMRRPHYKGRW